MIRIKDVVSGKNFFVDESKVDQFFDDYLHPENLIIVEDGDDHE